MSYLFLQKYTIYLELVKFNRYTDLNSFIKQQLKLIFLLLSLENKNKPVVHFKNNFKYTIG
jgi:hypothetical protein